MAIVRVSGVLLGIVMLVLAGCFVGTGPTLANALDVNLEVILRYADGDIKNLLFKPGMSVHVGKRDLENDPWKVLPIEEVKVIPIEEVVIKEAGRVLHQFNAEEVRLLIEKQDRNWWCIDREKVYLAHSPITYPDAREYCSKGKRLWTWENGRFMEEPAGPD